MFFVSWPASAIFPPGAAPALIAEAAKNSLAVKSWPPPDWLMKVSVTGLPAARWSGRGAKPKLQTWTATCAGWAMTGGARKNESAAALANRNGRIRMLLSSVVTKIAWMVQNFSAKEPGRKTAGGSCFGFHSSFDATQRVQR